MLRNQCNATTCGRNGFLNEVLSLNAQEYDTPLKKYTLCVFLNEVLSLNAQESFILVAHLAGLIILNEVLSLNAQE